MLGRIVGKYRITRKLGEGGMGVLYEAVYPQLDKRAVVKMLRPHLSENEEIARRLISEAKAAARIRHSGIVDVLDVGRLPDGQVYILMEYLEGENLADRLKRTPVLPEHVAVQLMAQAADALSAAHEAGIIHRDLKPDNMFLVPDPIVPGGERVKLLDFGIAKLATADASMETKSGVMLGTPQYMSPEQCRGAALVDARSDLYSLGVILFEILSGERPFNKKSMYEYFKAHDTEEPPFLRDKNPAVSLEVSRIVDRLMEKDPDRRFGTARELVIALIGLAAPQPGTPTLAIADREGDMARPRGRSRRVSRGDPTVRVSGAVPVQIEPVQSMVSPSLSGRASLAAASLSGRASLAAAASLSGRASLAAAASFAPAARTLDPEPGRLAAASSGHPSHRSGASPAAPVTTDPAQDLSSLSRFKLTRRVVGGWSALWLGAIAAIIAAAVALNMRRGDGARPEAQGGVEMPAEGDTGASAKLATLAVGGGRVGAGADRDRAPRPPSAAELRAMAWDEIEWERAPEPGPSPVTSIHEVVVLIQQGKQDEAIAGIHKLMPTNRKSAYLPFLLGNLYFEKTYWSDGLTAYAHAIANNRIYAQKEIVIENAILALSSEATKEQAKQLILSAIGAHALPQLREASTIGPTPAIQQRAEWLVKRLGK